MAYIKAYTNSFDILKDTVREYTPKMVATFAALKKLILFKQPNGLAKVLPYPCIVMGLNQVHSRH